MNAADFRAAMAALPEPPVDSAPPQWDFWRHDLWWRAQHDPRPMWDWPCLRHTMLVEHFPIGAQTNYLREDWPRWERAVADANPVHQKNLIMQAAHLRLWEQTTGRRVEDLEMVYEFGGGYGALAQLVRRLGFTGEYLVCDLPEFALLQDYFLGEGVVRHVTAPARCDLFVALYSLSETPLEFRDEFLSGLDAGSMLLLYSSRFAEYDNLEWIRRVVAERPGLRWTLPQMEQRPDWYAVGWKP